MMSKNSFLVNMKENNKRRIWVWVISILCFVLAYPVGVALMIKQAQTNLDWIKAEYGAAAESILQSRLLENVKYMTGTNLILMCFTVAIAVIAGIQGFSFLYSRKKIDFYMGMPVKQSRRFLVIWVNGILIFLLPYLLGMGISLLLAAGNQACSGEILATALRALGIYFCLFLGMYHLSILAVMLTGNMVVTGLGLLVLCLYEFMVRAVDYGYKSLFFQYFGGYFYEQLPLISPIGLYEKLVSGNGREGLMLAAMLAFALVIGLLSYFCYCKRPLEAAGKAIAFAKLGTIIKILLVIPAALLVGEIVGSVVDFYPLSGMDGVWYVLTAILLTTILGCGIIQVIYEFDIRGALHQKGHILICAVLAVGCFSNYRYDLLGFDRFVPKPDQVESIAFIPSTYDEGGYSDLWIDRDSLKLISGMEYAKKYMYLQNVEDVCLLADYSMREYNKIDRAARGDEENGYWSYATILYRMKSGRTVERAAYINMEDEQSLGLLEKIIDSNEFLEGYNVAATDGLERKIEQTEDFRLSSQFGNGVYENRLSAQDTRELLEAYREDLKETGFQEKRQEVPAGVLSIGTESAYWYYGGDSASDWWNVGLNIYPSYERCMKLLAEKDCEAESQLQTEDIAQIVVVNENQDMEFLREQEYMSGEAAMTATSAGGTIVKKSYEEQEEITRIAESIYPEALLNYRWDNGPQADYEISVIVYFKPGTRMDKQYGTNAYYRFVKGTVPDFVLADTAYVQE